MKYKIPFIKPNFPNSDAFASDYEAIIRSNWFTNFGPFEQKFSKEAGDFLGKNVHATSISNCTLGLEAAISILVKKDNKKKIIIPSFTFAAGVEAIIRCGFEPIFIDINADSLQPNIEQAKLLIDQEDNQIGGILLCNIFGVGNRDIESWEKFAKTHNLPLIIDSAAGFGSKYSVDERIGGRGDCEVFSMHATKPFAIGEGGLVSSKDKSFINKVRSWQNFGFESDRKIHMIGTNAKMQEINAAIGLQQLGNFNATLSSRHNTLKIYKGNLSKANFLFQENDHLSTVPFVSIVVDSSIRAKIIISSLIDNGVEARNYYLPLHLEASLKKYISVAGPLSVTEKTASSIVSLPVHDNMSEHDIRYITDCIMKAI